MLLAPKENAGVENAGAGFDAVTGAGAIDGKLAEPKAGAAGVDEDGVALKLNDVDWLLLFVPNENAGADAAALVDCGFVARVLLPNGFVVLFGWPNTNDVADNEGAGAVVPIVGTLKRFGSVDTSVLWRFNEIDLVLSSVELGAPNKNVGFGGSTDVAGWITTFSRTFTLFFSFVADDDAVSVTSDENVVGEPNFGAPNAGAVEPKPNWNGFEAVVVAVDDTVELSATVFWTANCDPNEGCDVANENVLDVDVTVFDEVTVGWAGAPNW